MSATQARFFEDLAAINAELARLDAIITDPTDGWRGVDPSKAPAQLLGIYSDLVSVGYANGWL